MNGGLPVGASVAGPEDTPGRAAGDGVGVSSGAQAASVSKSANANSASFTGLKAAPAVPRDQAPQISHLAGVLAGDR